jgi:hypothetical protein
VVLHALLLPGLEPIGELEDGHELVGRPVVDPEEISPLQMGGNHACILAFPGT